MVDLLLRLTIGKHVVAATWRSVGLRYVRELVILGLLGNPVAFSVNHSRFFLRLLFAVSGFATHACLQQLKISSSGLNVLLCVGLLALVSRVFLTSKSIDARQVLLRHVLVNSLSIVVILSLALSRASKLIVASLFSVRGKLEFLAKSIRYRIKILKSSILVSSRYIVAFELESTTCCSLLLAFRISPELRAA